MAKIAPDKAYREGPTILQIADTFRDEALAEARIADQRWPHGLHGPECGFFGRTEDRVLQPRCAPAARRVE